MAVLVPRAHWCRCSLQQWDNDWEKLFFFLDGIHFSASILQIQPTNEFDSQLEQFEKSNQLSKDKTVIQLKTPR
jgi:hypothetical protein